MKIFFYFCFIKMCVAGAQSARAGAENGISVSNLATLAWKIS